MASYLVRSSIAPHDKETITTNASNQLQVNIDGDTIFSDSTDSYKLKSRSEWMLYSEDDVSGSTTWSQTTLPEKAAFKIVVLGQNSEDTNAYAARLKINNIGTNTYSNMTISNSGTISEIATSGFLLWNSAIYSTGYAEAILPRVSPSTGRNICSIRSMYTSSTTYQEVCYGGNLTGTGYTITRFDIAFSKQFTGKVLIYYQRDLD